MQVFRLQQGETLAVFMGQCQGKQVNKMKGVDKNWLKTSKNIVAKQLTTQIDITSCFSKKDE